MTSAQVKVNRALSVPPVAFDLPLAANHTASATIAPPSAHIGIAPVQMRLISYDLREGQVPLFIHFYSVLKAFCWISNWIPFFVTDKLQILNTLKKPIRKQVLCSSRLRFYFENLITQSAQNTCKNTISS